MKIFLSWSGERSRAVAAAFHEWLPSLNPSFEPWMSEEDIEKGQRWSASIAGELAASKVGVICVTSENASKPWLNFEAGAISRTVTDAYVCPLLLDLAPADLTGPLKEFQATRIEKPDVAKLIETFNRALKASGEKAFEPGPLERAFDRAWPELKSRLTEVPRGAPPQNSETSKRTDREILDDILETVRRLEREGKSSQTSALGSLSALRRATATLPQDLEALQLELMRLGAASREVFEAQERESEAQERVPDKRARGNSSIK